MNLFKKGALLTGLSLILAACGGGGGGGGSEPAVAAAPPVQPAANCATGQVVGPARNDGLRIDKVQWLQVAGQDDTPSTLLAGGKDTLLRVDLLANSLRNAPDRMELRVMDPATGECSLVTLRGPSRVPTALDQTILSRSYVASIPAALMKPQTLFNLLMDDSTGRSASEGTLVTRSMTPDIRPAIREQLVIIPLRFAGSTGYVPTSDSMISDLLMRLHPVSSLVVTRTAAFTPPTLAAHETGISSYQGSWSDMQAVLNDVDDRCQQLIGNAGSAASSPKCLAVFPDNVSFRPNSGNGQLVGLAYVGGVVMLTQSFDQVDNLGVTSPYLQSHWMTARALTVAHEYGHVLDLDHAACGGTVGIDPRLLADGLLDGGNGYDNVRQVYFSSLGRLGEFADLMSYCGKEWTSINGYQATIGYRAPTVAGMVLGRMASAAVSSQWIKLMPGANGWQVTAVNFPPSRLSESPLSATVDSSQASESMKLQQAVISDGDTGDQGPYYLNLGQRDVIEIGLPATSIAPDSVVTPADWVRTGG